MSAPYPMSGSADPTLTPVLPAYAAELAKGRRRGLRPQTAAEARAASAGAGLDFEVVVLATDSWALAKRWRAMGRAAVVIEQGPLYDFKWARGWVVQILTSAPFTGLREWVQEQGALWALHRHDPAAIRVLEERARARA